MSSCLSHNRIRKRALEWGTEKVKCGLLNSYWQRPDSPNTLARELQMFWLCSDTTFSTWGSQHRHHSHAFHLSPCKHQQAEGLGLAQSLRCFLLPDLCAYYCFCTDTISSSFIQQGTGLTYEFCSVPGWENKEKMYNWQHHEHFVITLQITYKGYT